MLFHACRVDISQLSGLIITSCFCTITDGDQRLSRSAKPTLHQLDLVEGNGRTVRVIRCVAASWEQVAARLHFEPSDISRIERDNPNQCQAACQKMFSEWLAGESLKPISWNTLIKALNEADFSEIASDLGIIINVTP